MQKCVQLERIMQTKYTTVRNCAYTDLYHLMTWTICTSTVITRLVAVHL